MAIYGHGYNVPRVTVYGGGIFYQIFGLGAIIFAPDMLESQSGL